MSGRIRTIKPELLDDAVTANLSDAAFRLFIAMILLADDYGNLRFEPAWIRAQVFWARDRSTEEVGQALAELSGLVRAYEVGGQRYGAIRNWAKHQKVSHPGAPRVPGPPEGLPRPSGVPPEDLVPDLRSPISDPDPDLRSPTPRASAGAGEVRRIDVGTAGAVEARDAFEIAVAKATGEPFSLASAPFHDRDLVKLVNKHGRGLPRDWLAKTVPAWVRATEAQFAGGWVPAKLLDWLNTGKPDRRARKSAAEITKQPFDENAPWMKVAE